MLARVGSFDRMLLAVRQAGVIAREFQGRVTNEGKISDVRFPSDSARLRVQREAKTVVDDVVQEILILAALECLDPGRVILDAEEKTKTASLFASIGTGDSTLVIDPIDGTIEYLAGRDTYSVCLCVVSAGAIESAFVYFPARDTIFYLDESRNAMLAEDVHRNGVQKARPLESKWPVESNIVFVNGRVPADVQTAISGAGFEVIDDTVANRGVGGCILACLRGEAIAYVAHTRQVRDIMLGGLTGASRNGYAIDWTGQNLYWPAGGRVPRAVFGVGAAPQALLECLQRDDGVNDLAAGHGQRNISASRPGQRVKR